MVARSSLLRRPTPGARPARRTSSVVAALAALAPRLVRLAPHHYPDGLLARYAAALPPPLPPRGSFTLEHALHRLFRLFGSSTSPSSTLWHTFLHDAQMK